MSKRLLALGTFSVFVLYLAHVESPRPTSAESPRCRWGNKLNLIVHGQAKPPEKAVGIDPRRLTARLDRPLLSEVRLPRVHIRDETMAPVRLPSTELPRGEIIRDALPPWRRTPVRMTQNVPADVRLPGGHLTAIHPLETEPAAAELVETFLVRSDFYPGALLDLVLDEPRLPAVKLPCQRLQLAALNPLPLSRAGSFDQTVPPAKLYPAGRPRAKLGRATLPRARLPRPHQARARLSRANLPRAILQEASIVRAHITDADLPRAFLQRAALKQQRLEPASLRKAKLRRATLTRATLLRPLLSQAKLPRATLPQATIGRATLPQATLPVAVH